MSNQSLILDFPECVREARPHLDRAKKILELGGYWDGELLVGPFVKRTPLTEHANDLLEALKDLLSSDDQIAKASDADLQGAIKDQEVDPIIRMQASAALKARAAIAKAEGR